MLLKPGQESHSYDPSAKDIVEISGCDLFVYNGGESDQWVESVLKSAPEVETFRMTDAVSLLDEEVTEGMQNAGSTTMTRKNTRTNTTSMCGLPRTTPPRS